MGTLHDRIATGDLPASLRGVLMPFAWDLDRLLALDLPRRDVLVSDLAWMLDLPLWREDGEWFVVTPNEVRAAPEDHPDQWNRTLRCDLSAPIHVTVRDGRLVIMDGVHRLLSAAVDGVASLPARELPVDRWSEVATVRGERAADDLRG